MKKKKWVIALAIVLALVAIAITYVAMQFQKAKVDDIKYELGLKHVFERLPDTSSLLKKKYYYFNVWNTRCVPCIEEMPMLDSIAKELSGKIGLIYLSDDDDEKVNNFLKRKNIHSNRFYYMNDMNEFISSVYQQHNLKYKVFPVHFVTDSIGNILYFKQGGLTYFKATKNKKPDAADLAFMKKFEDPLVKFLRELE